MTGQLEAILARLFELERAATRGPWRFVQEGRGQFDLLPSEGVPPEGVAGGDGASGTGALGTFWRDEPGKAEADAALVCALRNAVPEIAALVDRCRAAEIEAERLRFEVQLYRERWRQSVDALEEFAPTWHDGPRPIGRDEQPLAAQIA